MKGVGTVTVVGDGREAVALAQYHSFDLILMDIQMPEMDGYEATTAIREDEKSTGRHVPIIAMTAHAMKGDRDRWLAAGMDDFSPNPFTSKNCSRWLGNFTPMGAAGLIGLQRSRRRVPCGAANVAIDSPGAVSFGQAPRDPSRPRTGCQPALPRMRAHVRQAAIRLYASTLPPGSAIRASIAAPAGPNFPFTACNSKCTPSVCPC